ncbi:hypothetical protein Syun_019900 [Stephania yunnanensis]|uniref:Uncharacterized protein n=1 Tax=Stephania yunnanensis TaxID=152371 RepID=A0AAP0IWN8_9MAGN
MLQLEELEVETELDLLGLFLLLISPSNFCRGTSRRCKHKFFDYAGSYSNPRSIARCPRPIASHGADSLDRLGISFAFAPPRDVPIKPPSSPNWTLHANSFRWDWRLGFLGALVMAAGAIVLGAPVGINVVFRLDLQIFWVSALSIESHDRKIALTSLTAFGCLPLERATNIMQKHACREDYNQVARDFNTKLIALIDKLGKEAEGVQMVYSNVYDSLAYAIAKPNLYGFENVDLWFFVAQEKVLKWYYFFYAGFSGLTAYGGFYNLCKPKNGEKVFVDDDLKQGVPGAIPIPPDDAEKEKVILCGS